MTASQSRPTDAPALLAALPPRALSSHKGDHGHVLIMGGGLGMRGAAVLAAQAALWIGAGRISLAFADDAGPDYLAGLPEVLRPSLSLATQLLPECVVVIGPGLGQDFRARALLDQAVATATRLVLDADALSLLAQSGPPPAWPTGQQRWLTPHPGEAARLLSQSTAAVQADRAASARRLARDWQAEVVLKGAGSLICGAAGEVWINTSGNPGLAASGMGDTLCGILAGLLAQGLPGPEALRLAVWLHGAAADHLVAQGLGPRGLTASEVAVAARTVLNGGIAPPLSAVDESPLAI
jgi:hydroxyethylthiazole kinase-like uncharacterized protein yjeF